MRKRRGGRKRIKQNGENTNKMQGKPFEHDVRIAVTEIFD